MALWRGVKMRRKGLDTCPLRGTYLPLRGHPYSLFSLIDLKEGPHRDS